MRTIKSPLFNFFCIFLTFLTLSLSFIPQTYAAGLSYDEARHLLLRTEFAAPHRRVMMFQGLSRSAAARKIIRSRRIKPTTPLPAWFNHVGRVYKRDLTDRLLKKKNRQQRRRMRREEFRAYAKELPVWWWTELLNTDSPFTERMTIFWHNHFATSIKKVRRPDYMLAQNLTLRQHALGQFDDMLHAIAKDPAMILYLDNQTNRKGAPNENFAREVMELFTVGEGHYSEKDIKEAARAFTGWTVDRRTGTFTKRLRQHDNGTKKVLGQRGNFDGEDILDMLLARPETALFICEKLWREFISPQPDPKEVTRLAKVFRSSGYDITTLMQTILTSDHFYARENRTSLIKSPVDYIAGTLRQFHIRPPDMRPLINLSRTMGQDLFSPPNVKGWPGGNDWINSNTLTMRQQFTNRVFRAQEMPTPPRDYIKKKKHRQKAPIATNFQLQDWLKAYPKELRKQRATIARNLVSELYWKDFGADIQDHSMSAHAFLKKLVKSPYYELK